MVGIIGRDVVQLTLVDRIFQATNTSEKYERTGKSALLTSKLFMLSTCHVHVRTCTCTYLLSTLFFFDHVRGQLRAQHFLQSFVVVGWLCLQLGW